MPYVPDPEVETDFKFVVTIPSYGKPERQGDELLERVTRHIQLSVSKRAKVELVLPKAPVKKAAKKAPATRKSVAKAAHVAKHSVTVKKTAKRETR